MSRRVSQNENECKDEVYEGHMRIINALRITLRRPEDRASLDSILCHCEMLHGCGCAAAQQHINHFLKYLEELLQRNCETQPLDIYEKWYIGSQESASEGVWMENGKMFFCMQKTKDGGIIFYQATATDPSAGWDKGGLLKL